MFELKQVRYFVAVAEELSFRRAADRLCITQPPLSQCIKALEESLNVQLFLRNTRSVQLTKAGETFLTQAYGLLDTANRSVTMVQQAAQGEVGTLRIGYSASAIFSKALTSALAELLTARPMLEVQLCEGNALDHIVSLRAGRLDAAVLRADLGAEMLGRLLVTRLADEPLYAVLPRGHSLASRASVEMHDLAGERLLLQPASQRTFLRRQVESLADRAGLSLDRALEVPDISSTLCFVSAGIGVAILPASAASIAHSLVIVPIADAGSSQPLILTYRDKTPLNDQLLYALSGR
ncbi:transcriptional regulator, LysR family [Halopseudomonas litoralis]|uniref:Transcriptional regulator, LysR family n=1 Tax=Halopseudomonas litoralis TaxID=797277 RepID=A0A1H1Q9R2_9GAMM|nr:LysR substrate-binding domain-containing protein [Halopseudomonas litoralis]SDS20261.1 transcriptional regulator, LysR family [Halopseudomonas litoralis]